MNLWDETSGEEKADGLIYAPSVCGKPYICNFLLLYSSSKLPSRIDLLSSDLETMN